MTKHDQIVKEISEKLGKDKRVVDKVSRSQFTFTTKVVRDPEDNRPVMYRYLGKFVLLTGRVKRKD